MDVGGEHLVGFVREVPDFVHVLNDVTSIDGFFQFGAGCSRDSARPRRGCNGDRVRSAVWVARVSHRYDRGET